MDEIYTCEHDPKIEPHTCPFKEEVWGDTETLCRCCDRCAEECAREV